MQSRGLLEELSARMAEFLAADPARDAQRNVRALLSAGLTRLDLLTREEFDVQAKLLQRTLEKLAQLEARVAELERRAATD